MTSTPGSSAYILHVGEIAECFPDLRSEPVNLVGNYFLQVAIASKIKHWKQNFCGFLGSGELGEGGVQDLEKQLIIVWIMVWPCEENGWQFGL